MEFLKNVIPCTYSCKKQLRREKLVRLLLVSKTLPWITLLQFSVCTMSHFCSVSLDTATCPEYILINKDEKLSMLTSHLITHVLGHDNDNQIAVTALVE